jgi:hypothetical protein
MIITTNPYLILSEDIQKQNIDNFVKSAVAEIERSFFLSIHKSYNFFDPNNNSYDSREIITNILSKIPLYGDIHMKTYSFSFDSQEVRGKIHKKMKEFFNNNLEYFEQGVRITKKEIKPQKNKTVCEKDTTGLQEVFFFLDTIFMDDKVFHSKVGKSICRQIISKIVSKSVLEIRTTDIDLRRDARGDLNILLDIHVGRSNYVILDNSMFDKIQEQLDIINENIGVGYIEGDEDLEL